MAGDPDNARLWADADVYVSFNTSATVPADVDTAFGVDWDLVGLLNGDDGFVTARNEDSPDSFAWGGILMRTSHRNKKVTRTFTAFEWNETTRRLAWPGSEPGIIRWSQPEEVLVAWETRDGDTVHRLISAGRAEVNVDGDITENEPDVSSISFVVTVYPTGDGDLFVEQETETGS